MLLYDCPAGLVLYWTLNNLFSLTKNLLQKFKDPLKLLTLAATTSSLVLLLLPFLGLNGTQEIFKIILLFILLNLPLMFLLGRKFPRKPVSSSLFGVKAHSCFLEGCLFMTVLLGLLIPSALVRSSPEEFILRGVSCNPILIYVLGPFLLAAGFFLIWLPVFYFLSGPRLRRGFTGMVLIVCTISLADYLFFGKDYGILNNWLLFEQPFHNTPGAIFRNLALLLILALLTALLLKKARRLVSLLGAAFVAAGLCMSVFNLAGSQKIIVPRLDRETTASHFSSELFTLSKEGKNVVILMMDRAVSAYLPYIFAELPQLQQQFAGFTYYPNTLSTGGFTNFGLPGIFGGYEYTTYAMNQRKELPLAEKHNEALKMLPILFDSRDYEVTVCNPSYADYHLLPDLRIFEDVPGIRAINTQGSLNRVYDLPQLEEILRKRTCFYCLMKISPLCLQEPFYHNGAYNIVGKEEEDFRVQIETGPGTAKGRNSMFDENYDVLRTLPSATIIQEGNTNTFGYLCNELTHNPTLLQLPDYVPADSVDNTLFESEIPVRTDENGNTLVLEHGVLLNLYHCNAAAYLQLGNWLDYLRENGVYDNTRIIIVSDHACGTGTLPVFTAEDGFSIDLSFYNPLLMVKEFDSRDFKTDHRLMTHAEVPVIACRELIPDPVNPFTGNPLTSLYDHPGPIPVFTSSKWSIDDNHGNTFLPDHWLTFNGQDIRDLSGWQDAGFGVLPDVPLPG